MASSYDRRSSSSASRPRGAGQETFEGYGEADARPSVRRGRDPRKESYYKRMRLMVTSVVALLLVLVGYVVVVYSPLFEIKRITANPTEHVTSEAISALAAVPGGSTLFNVDEKGIAERLAADPWIESVSLARSFPNELVITVTERVPAGIVMLSNGGEAWRIGSDGCWIEPVELLEATADNGVAAPADQAYAAAVAEGLVYICDVSALVKPEAGVACTDEAIAGAMEYLEGFSDALRTQVAVIKASTRESISVVLASGIEVSLGAPDDIALKERVVLALLEQYAGQITYINVRVPSSPSYRALDASQAGEDVMGTDVPLEDGTGDAAAAVDDGAAAADAGADVPADETDSSGALTGSDDGAPGGSLDEGGYYSDAGHWVYYYHDADGNLINGYYDDDGSWVSLA